MVLLTGKHRHGCSLTGSGVGAETFGVKFVDTSDLHMSEVEIERYFAAFPALGCPTRKSPYVKELAPTEKPVTGGLCTANTNIIWETIEFERQAAVKLTESLQTNNNYQPSYYTRENGVPPRPGRRIFHVPIKGRKSKPCRENKKDATREKKKQQPRLKESKPWKNLKDVTPRRHLMTGKAAVQMPDEPLLTAVVEATPVTQHDWLQLTPEEFASILSERTENYDLDSSQLQHIWASPNDISLPNGDSLPDGNPLLPNGNSLPDGKTTENGFFPSFSIDLQTTKSTIYGGKTSETCDLWNGFIPNEVTATACNIGPLADDSDYEDIEEKLASFRFCEEVDIMPDCRLKGLLEENPFSNMIRNTDYAKASASATPGQQMRPCKHCQQSYEICLDVELPTASRQQHCISILGKTDSRLNFDWTQYNPPPWLVFPEEPSESNRSPHRTSCDCDYCRSRIWRRHCRWCHTPL